MLPASWYPKQVSGLIRVGPRGDGGYVLPETVLDQVDTLISFGLSTDWRFEEDFRGRTGCAVECFDHSVTPLFWRNKFMRDVFTMVQRRRFGRWHREQLMLHRAYKRFFAPADVNHHQLMIGYDGQGSVSLDTVLERYGKGRMLLKCDIEGAEWRIADQIVAHQDQFCAIAAEFHDVDVHRDHLSDLIARLDRFDLVHIHANNWGGTDPAGDPMVLEITFLRKDLSADLPAHPPRAYPDADLDRPNRAGWPDIPLQFEADPAAAPALAGAAP